MAKISLEYWIAVANAIPVISCPKCGLDYRGQVFYKKGVGLAIVQRCQHAHETYVVIWPADEHGPTYLRPHDDGGLATVPDLPAVQA
jgi:hypothetical protein